MSDEKEIQKICNSNMKIIEDGNVGHLVYDRKKITCQVLTYLAAVILGFGAVAFAIMTDSAAYAATQPEIFMGTFEDEYPGDDISQMPETGDVITTRKTVVIRGSKWKLDPGFTLQSVETTDKKVTGVTKKKTYAVIKAKKAGEADITLTGVNGEERTYRIIVEDPKVKKLKVLDFESLNESDYITGTQYLKPTSVACNKKKIAQVYQDQYGENIINVFGSGTTNVTVRYGKYKRTGRIRGKLPYMVSKNVKLKNKPKKIKIRNVPKGWKPVYRSTDPDVAVCNNSGYVAPKGNGTATIYTRIGNTYLICHVTVSGFKP